MIIPIGHEETMLRRVPWVTFGIMIVCAVALLGTQTLRPAPAIGEARSLTELSRYYVAHPYLEIDEEALERVFPGAQGGKRAVLIEALRQASRPPSDQQILAEEQAEMDRLSRVALEAPEKDPFRRWGLVPARLTAVSLFTHMFVHAGWLHLLGNLLILYLAGTAIEDVWGRPLFAVFYFAAGLAGALLFALRYPDLDIPLVGASGAISGVMGAFLVRYMRTRIRFAYMIGLHIRGTFEAPAWLMLPLWLGEQLLGALLADMGALHGVAYLAHIGGFGFGAAVALGFRRLDIERRFLDHRIESKVTTVHVHRPALEQALAVKAAGDSEAAFALLKAEATRSPEDRDVGLALWDAAVEIGRETEAAPRMAGVIRQEIRGGEAQLAADHWIEMTSRVPHVVIEPKILVALAQALLQAGRRKHAREAIEAAMGEGSLPMEQAVALKMVRVAVALADELGRRAGALVLARSDLGPDVRGQVEALVARATPLSIGQIAR